MLPYSFINRRGIAEVVSASVTVGTDSVVFSFPNHAFYNAWYKGFVAVNLNQAIPSTTTATLPIVFETNGVRQSVTKRGGASLEVSDVTGTGVYLFYFDRSTNSLQLVN